MDWIPKVVTENLLIIDNKAIILDLIYISLGDLRVTRYIRVLRLEEELIISLLLIVIDWLATSPISIRERSLVSKYFK